MALLSFVADYHNNISSLSCSAHVIISIQCLSLYCWLVFHSLMKSLFVFLPVKTVGAKLQFPLAPRGDGEYKQGTYKVLNKLKA